MIDPVLPIEGPLMLGLPLPLLEPFPPPPLRLNSRDGERLEMNGTNMRCRDGTPQDLFILMPGNAMQTQRGVSLCKSLTHIGAVPAYQLNQWVAQLA